MMRGTNFMTLGMMLGRGLTGGVAALMLAGALTSAAADETAGPGADHPWMPVKANPWSADRPIEIAAEEDAGRIVVTGQDLLTEERVAELEESADLMKRLAAVFERIKQSIESADESERMVGLSMALGSGNRMLIEFALQMAMRGDDPALKAVALRFAIMRSQVIVVTLDKMVHPRTGETVLPHVSLTLRDQNEDTGRFAFSGHCAENPIEGYGDVNGLALKFRSDDGYCAGTFYLQPDERNGLLAGTVTAGAARGNGEIQAF